MEAPAAGEFEDWHHNLPAGSLDGGLRVGKIGRIKHDERSRFTACFPAFGFAESAVDAGAGLVEARVVGAVVLELPAETVA